MGEVGEQEEQGMGVEGEDGMRNWEEREKGRQWVNKKEQGENVKFSQYYSWPYLLHNAAGVGGALNGVQLHPSSLGQQER